jgi:hypothetical protein
MDMRALAASLIRQQRRGHGSVQGLDGRVHRNADTNVRLIESVGRQTSTLAADQDRERSGEVGVEERPAAARRRSHRPAVVPPDLGLKR